MALEMGLSIESLDSRIMGLLMLLAAAAGLAILCHRLLLSSALDPGEPPEVKASIPFVGHLFQLLLSQAGYLKELSLKFSFPVYTIRIFGARIYVINSPELIQKAFNNPKAFDFDLFVVDASKRLLGMSDADTKLFSERPEAGGPSYLSALHSLVNSSLAPGHDLSVMNARVESKVASDLNGISVEGTETSLHRWTRDVLTRALSSALYGSDNPIENDRSLIDSLWAVDSDFTFLLLPFPNIIARKAFKGRARLYSAFRSYYRSGLWENGAALVRNRMALATKYGFSEQTIADFEWSILYTSTTSAVPTAFWLLSYILADQELLDFIRSEVALLATLEIVDGGRTLTIDQTKIRAYCPLLISAWEETLRVATAPIAIRQVTADILLNNEYLLKSGAIVQMPGSVTHSSPSIWGKDAGVVDARRFLRAGDKVTGQEKEERKLQNQAYIPFGGGKHLCPGRHLAFTEILAFVSMVVYAFHVERKDGATFRAIKAQRQKQGAAVRKPDGDIEVVIRRRAEFEGVRLAFCHGGEDIVEKNYV